VEVVRSGVIDSFVNTIHTLRFMFSGTEHIDVAPELCYG
jgi:hypothetical protein